jgi:hypothetical protein
VAEDLTPYTKYTGRNITPLKEYTFTITNINLETNISYALSGNGKRASISLEK